MKKLNSTTYRYSSAISSYAQNKVIETNEGFLLNTVYHYDKEKFEPTTYQSFNNSSVATTLIDEIITDRYAGINLGNYNLNIPFFKDSCVPDLYNPNKYYILSRTFKCAFTESNGALIDGRKVYESYPVSNTCITSYLGQNEDSLFVACSIGNTTKYIYKVLKSTLAMTIIYTYYSYISNYGGGNAFKIKETNDYIYFYVRSTKATNSYTPIYMKINRIDKISGIVTELESFESESLTNTYKMSSCVDSLVEINNNVVGFYIRYPSLKCDAQNLIRYIQLDITDESSPVIEISTPTITGTLPTPISNITSEYIHNYVFTNADYLYIIRRYCFGRSSTENDIYLNNDQMYSFKIVKEENGTPSKLELIKFVESNQFLNSGLSTFLITSDKKVIIFCCVNGLHIWKLIEETGEYVETQRFGDNNILNYGIDTLNRLWVLHNDYSVSLVGLTDFAKYTLEFEKDSYSYLGEDIETYVKLKCIDILNNRITGNFSLVINGNAVFADNKSKSLTVVVHSDDVEDVTVPIIINGAGRVIIYPTLITE